MNSRPPIRVLICDDSAVVRSMMRRILDAEEDIEVVGLAADPYQAKDLILEKQPDVLTLDIEMPRLDGLSFLKIIMKERPMPVIIISSLSQKGSREAVQALQLGAVDVLGKPNGSFSLGNLKGEIVKKVRIASHVRLKSYRSGQTTTPSSTEAPKAIPPQRFHPQASILLGASTGGTTAIQHILTKLPASMPPIFIVQHIPPYFSKALAERLNSICEINVCEAKNGMRVSQGMAVIAPGNYHMAIQKNAQGWYVSLNQAPQVWHQRPSVDILFRSAAAHAPQYAVAALLTGMGKDGAQGLMALRKAGAKTFAEDESTCVVYGMPKAAYELGAAGAMIPLHQFPEQIIQEIAIHPLSPAV